MSKITTLWVQKVECYWNSTTGFHLNRSNICLIPRRSWCLPIWPSTLLIWSLLSAFVSLVPIIGFHLTVGMGWVTELRDLTPASRSGSTTDCTISSFNSYTLSNLSKGQYKLWAYFVLIKIFQAVEPVTSVQPVSLLQQAWLVSQHKAQQKGNRITSHLSTPLHYITKVLATPGHLHILKVLLQLSSAPQAIALANPVQSLPETSAFHKAVHKGEISGEMLYFVMTCQSFRSCAALALNSTLPQARRILLQKLSRWPG